MMTAKEQNLGKGRVQSVHRALTILNTVARYQDGIGVRELARELELKAPTAHALIKTLEQMTYLEHCPESRKYRLGLGAIMLGFGAGTGWNTRISSIVKDLLEKLSEKLDETAVLFGFINGLIVTLDVVNRPHELNVRLTPGIFAQEPHVLANGKVLLANASKIYLENYAKNKEAANALGEEYSNAENLLADLGKIQGQGYAEVENLEDSGIYGVGVPMQGFFGRKDISVGTSLPLARVNASRKKVILTELIKTAKIMEKRIAELAEKMR